MERSKTEFAYYIIETQGREIEETGWFPSFEKVRKTLER
jgi:hypothetical protein